MKKEHISSSYSIWFPICIGLIFRLINIQAPIVGVHSWRQADTAAMARHFALENSPIWLPQIDWAGASKGYVECEFPIFPYIVGQLYKIFGIHEWIGRSLSIFFSLITILLVIRIGSLIFDQASGWWGGLFFALLPLNVYYGRAFQAESLLILASALSIERLLVWGKGRNRTSLFLSWISFCVACLIKLLPIVWLGIPFIVAQLYSEDINEPLTFKEIFRRFSIIFKSIGPFLYGSTAIIITFIWFKYAYSLGQESGLSFLTWEDNSDRIRLDMLMNIKVWLNLFLRIILRNMAIIGFPLVILGLWDCYKKSVGQILWAGLIGMLLTTIFFMGSSSIHEYYQLPLQLFLCPLMGRGWKCLHQLIHSFRMNKLILSIILLLISTISITILTFDYFLVEKTQSKIWMPLATRVRNEVKPESRIVSVTGMDPTFLNLSRRQGWLTSIKDVNQTTIKYWAGKGATHLVGSLNWAESYVRLNHKDSQNFLDNIICKNNDFLICNSTTNSTYFIPINELID